MQENFWEEIRKSEQEMRRDISEKLGVTTKLRAKYAKQEIFRKALPIIEKILALEESKKDLIDPGNNIEQIKGKLDEQKKLLEDVERQLEILVIKTPSETVKEQLTKLDMFVKRNRIKLENNQEEIEDIAIDKFTEKINIKNLKSNESKIRSTINNLETTLSALIMASKLEEEISQLKGSLSQVVPYAIDVNNFQILEVSIIERGMLKAERDAFGVIKREFEKLYKVVEDLKKPSRKIRVFLVGNTGSCKSSLINVLSNSEIATVGHSKPLTTETKEYDVSEVNAVFIDSRGLHEGKSLETNLHISAEDQILEDLKKHNPDVIIYTVTPSDWRKFGNELASPLRRIQQLNTKPIILLLTKADEDVEIEDDRFKEIAGQNLNQIKMGLEKEGIFFHSQIFCTTKAITKKGVWTIKDSKDSTGIDELIGVINLLSSMDAQLVENPVDSQLLENVDLLKSNMKRGVGRKIIFAFAGISLGLSPIPFVDPVLQLLLRAAMVKLLSNLFGTKEKNLDSFLKDKKIFCTTTLIADIMLSAASITFDFIGLVTFGVGYAVSTCTSALVQPPLTLAAGFEAFHYFTGIYLLGTSVQEKLSIFSKKHSANDL